MTDVPTILRLSPETRHFLDDVAPGTFDNAIDPRWTAEFIADPRHHMFLAVVRNQVVGMVSGVDYVHPDKPPELWVNEVGVADAYRRRGIAKRLMEALFEHATTLGCTDAWLGTEPDNTAALRLYAAMDGQAEAMTCFTFELDDEDDD